MTSNMSDGQIREL